MKKIIYTLAFMVGVLLSGCGKKTYIDTDYATWDVCFDVRNAAGENLMDPQVEGNWLDRDIYVEYRNKTYPMSVGGSTRTNPPIWQGLRTGQDYWGKEPIRLMFGEFGPESNHKGETFTIFWGDGTSDEVRFDLYLKRHKVRHGIWFEGKQKQVTCSFNISN